MYRFLGALLYLALQARRHAVAEQSAHAPAAAQLPAPVKDRIGIHLTIHDTDTPSEAWERMSQQFFDYMPESHGMDYPPEDWLPEMSPMVLSLTFVLYLRHEYYEGMRAVRNQALEMLQESTLIKDPEAFPWCVEDELLGLWDPA